MKVIQPKQPKHLSSYAQISLKALVQAGLMERIALGGALGLFHYLDYRLTHDVDAWWAEHLSESQKQEVLDAVKGALASFGKVELRRWGDVSSIALLQDNKVIFSFQIAQRSVRLETPVSAGWINIPLDSLADLIASKMVALIERGAPRDFLDIYMLCQSELVTPVECWALWHTRQVLADSDTDGARARLAIETHLERIIQHRPLETIHDAQQQAQAQQVRNWFRRVFLPEV